MAYCTTVPVAVTAGVWHDCVRVPEGMVSQDETGRVCDVLTMLHHAIRRAPAAADTVTFQVLVLDADYAILLHTLRAVED